MKILQDNRDRTILLNSETNFGTDLGWEESFQEFEHETLKSIINPVENFETVRYIHSGYTSELGIYQHDIWYEFYFANFTGGTDGGLNYERIGLSSEENAKLLRSKNTSFFRLEFYKVPVGENPNSKNRKLVFTRQLPIPMGEQVYYTPISQEIYVPVFTGSNYRNKENMYLYWFQDETVFEGTLLSGNTFYMAVKFFNTIDGTNIAFLNKEKNVSDSIDEEQDMYRRVEIDRSNYSYVVYTGITTDHRAGESISNTPIRCYAASVSNEIGGTPRVAYQITTTAFAHSTPASACVASPYSGAIVYLQSGYDVPQIGITVYTTATGTGTVATSGSVYVRIESLSTGATYAVRTMSPGVITSVDEC